LRKRPTKPQRTSHTRTIYIESGLTFDKILTLAAETGLKPAEMTLHHRELDDYGNCGCHFSYKSDMELEYQEPESDEAWGKRLATYRKNLALWQQWSEDHQEEIDARLKEESEKIDALRAKTEERSRKSLEREANRVEKRLRTLRRSLLKQAK
jgi:hypothetical protein